MADKNEKENQKDRKRLYIGIGIGAGVLVLAIGALLAWYLYFLNQYEGKFYPGVTVNGSDLSGKTYMEILNEFDEGAQRLEEEGITIVYTAAPEEIETLPSVTVLPATVPLTASGFSQEIYTSDHSEALDEAFAVGREDSLWTRMSRQYSAARSGRVFTIPYTFNSEIVQEMLDEEFTEYENPAVNANIAINDAGEVEVIDESIGQAFDDESILVLLEQQLIAANTTPIEVTLTSDYPTITIDDVKENIPQIESYLALAPITLFYEDNSWEYDRVALGGWMTFESGELAISSELLDESLTEPKEKIDVAVKEARWRVISEDGTNVSSLEEMSPSENGQAINMEDMAAAIYEWLQGDADALEPLELVVDVTEPEFTPENADEMGIEEKLGTGYSNMAGSPANRQVNIKRGVELLNGLLVGPDEEFCLNPALKPYTTANGYLSELVIKGTETIPEIGGGLCQVGTTSFRAAMDSGLDITARQNHSYQVSYYNDPRNGNPGTDATIYDPWPDFCFHNDTPAYILMQTRLDGTELYFDYFGTNDGREANFSEPVAYNWVSPPPVKEIETEDLAPGERRCTESAHRGVTAEFTYSIDYADGSQHEELFKSVYKPWQAVCQVGKEKEEEQPPEEEAPVEQPPAEEPPKEEEKKDDKKKNN